MNELRILLRLIVEETVTAASGDCYAINVRTFYGLCEFRRVEIGCHFGKVLACVEIEPYLASPYNT